MNHKMLTGWIPVEEQLPEETCNYLCTVITDDGTLDTPLRFCMIGHFNRTAKGGFWADDDRRRRTVAWMPLPKTWKGR